MRKYLTKFSRSVDGKVRPSASLSRVYTKCRLLRLMVWRAFKSASFEPPEVCVGGLRYVYVICVWFLCVLFVPVGLF